MRKKIISHLIMILLSSILMAGCSDFFKYFMKDLERREPHVVINEFFCTPPGEYYKNVWIELYNPTAEDIDISYWWLSFNSVSTINEIPANTIITKNGLFILCSDSNTLTNNWKIPEGMQLVSHMIPCCANDTLTLYRWTNGTKPQKVIIDELNYGDEGNNPVPLVPDWHSIARYAGGYDTDNCSKDFYDESSPTPGAMNNCYK